MNTTTKPNHALLNALGHLEEMVENYEIGSYIESSNPTTQEQEEKLEEIRESILNSALSVEFRSGWSTNPEQLEIEENYAVNPKMQFQDWGTCWTDYELTEKEEESLNWFCNCFYFGS